MNSSLQSDGKQESENDRLFRGVQLNRGEESDQDVEGLRYDHSSTVGRSVDSPAASLLSGDKA